MQNKSSARKVTLNTSDILQNALKAEARKPQPYHYLWSAFLRHRFNCKTMCEVDRFNPEKTRDFLHCLALFTEPVPANELRDIGRMSNDALVKEFFESHGKNFYQLPTYVVRHFQMKLFPFMKPSYWNKYVYEEESSTITLDDDMHIENMPPNVKDLFKGPTVKDLLKGPTVKDLSIRKSFDQEEEEEEESFF